MDSTTFKPSNFLSSLGNSYNQLCEGFRRLTFIRDVIVLHVTGSFFEFYFSYIYQVIPLGGVSLLFIKLNKDGTNVLALGVY